MQITITGPRGCGSTTAAIEIAKFLQSLGADVSYRGGRRTQEYEFLELLEAQRDSPPHRLDDNRIVIVDGVEPEDERGVASRFNKKKR